MQQAATPVQDRRRAQEISCSGPVSWPAPLLDLFAAARSRRLRSPEQIGALVREHLVRGLHVQAIRPGDRLPSVRDAAAALGVTHHTALKVYAGLQEEGLVEARACSGTYVAPLDRALEQPLGETAEWLIEVLEQACAHRIRIPLLPDLIHRWTAATTLRCACIAGTEDDEYALLCEMEQQYGAQATGVRLEHFPCDPSNVSLVPEAAVDADAWIATTLAAPRVQPLADALGKPLVTAAMSADRVRAVQGWIAENRLNVVCVDPAFGTQMRQLFAAARPDRVRVVLASDRPELESLDPTEPVYLTRAARDHLGSVTFRLLVAPTGAFCDDFARSVVALLVAHNVRDRRSLPLRVAAPANS